MRCRPHLLCSSHVTLLLLERLEAAVLEELEVDIVRAGLQGEGGGGGEVEEVVEEVVVEEAVRWWPRRRWRWWRRRW